MSNGIYTGITPEEMKRANDFVSVYAEAEKAPYRAWGATLEKRKQKAAELFSAGYNCSQSVFAAFCDLTGYDEKAALRLASSFGGGIARHRDVCGAVSGAAMVLGMLYGYDKPDKEACKEHYARVSEFLNAFKEANGSLVCRELLQLTAEKVKHDEKEPTPTERNEAFYKGRPCMHLVISAVELLAKEIEKIENNK